VCPVCETGRRAPDPPARSGERGEAGPASDGRGRLSPSCCGPCSAWGTREGGQSTLRPHSWRFLHRSAPCCIVGMRLSDRGSGSRAAWISFMLRSLISSFGGCRWTSPISQRLPPDHAQTSALQAGRAGGCVLAQDSALVPGVRLRVRSHHARASCALGFVAALDAGRHHPAIRGGTPKSRREKPPAFA
jgi:hypothetical protein